MSTRSEPGDGRSEPSPSAITSERYALINLAYRMLGSLGEAEDAVQEAHVRWYAMTRQQQQAIDSPGAWLMKVNGQPGLVVQQAAATVIVLAFTVTANRITHIWAVRNPEKLRSWSTGRQVPLTDMQ